MPRQWKLNLHANIAPAVAAAGARGLQQAVQEILATSQAKVPVDTGQLRDSGFARLVDDDLAVVGYTDPKAAAAHENLHVRYRQGQAKFLEQAVAEHSAAVLERVARAVTTTFR